MEVVKDFPILNQEVNGCKLVYLDNSATTQKPKQVIETIKSHYEKDNANVHRGIHELSQRSSEAYDKAREIVAKFVNASFEEIIFTKSCTESLNLLAYSLDVGEGDEIVVTEMEHHSNIVPWQELAKRKGAVLKFIPITEDYRLDMDKAKEIINNKTKIVSVAHMSNVLGTVNPVKELTKLARSVNALIVVDGAQSVPHMKIDVKDLDCDFLAFSGHKMLGPTGVGVLYGKKKLLEKMSPFLFGGGMIKEVSFSSSEWDEIPMKFEAGTPNITGAIALSEAVKYLENIGMENVQSHCASLTEFALEELSKLKDLKIIGPVGIGDRGPVISFAIESVHPHDVSEILNREGVAIRGGHHCAMPLHKKLGLQGTSRASFYVYNTKEDVGALVEALKKTKEIFK